jgi:hypothetical protein
VSDVLAADDPLQAEVAKLLALAAERARAWDELARRRRGLHYGIGVPAVVLAALAGAAALAELSSVIAGLCALAAAVLTGLQTFLRPDAGAVRAREQAIGWREIEDDTRILLEIDYAHLEGDRRRTRFDDLHAKARALQRATAKGPAGTSPRPNG